jgi:hypothetical protein
MDAILKALKLRKSVSPFGYGLGTAVNHVKRFVQAASLTEMKQFGVSAPSAVAKEVERASGILTFCDPGMVRDEKVFTSSNDMKDILPDGVKLPEKTMFVMQHVLTTDRVDRDNDILRTSGAKLDPKAPLLWQHMHSMPIGGVLFEVNHTGTELKVASALLDMNEITHDAGILVMANMLRFSHGFRVLDFEEREQKDGEHGWPGFDNYFKSYQKELVESRPLVVAAPDVDSQLMLRFDGKSVEITPAEKKQVEPESIGVAAKQADAPTQSAKDGIPYRVESGYPEIDKDVAPVVLVQSPSLDAPFKTLIDRISEVLEGCDKGTAFFTFGEILAGFKDKDEADLFDEVKEWAKEAGVVDAEPTEADAVNFLLRCNDETILKRLRDIAAGRLELADRKALAKEVEMLVGA